MSKYVLCDWEINGYNDSDFMLMYYDDVTNELKSFEYDTTRFAGCMCRSENALPTPPQGSSSYHLHAQLEYNTVEAGKEGKYVVKEQGEWLLMPTLEVVERARKVLEERAFQALTQVDKVMRDEPTPSDLHDGMKLYLKERVRNQVSLTERCTKCNGTGKWTNPRNPEDKRDCFACKGQGTHKVGKAKGEDGKLKYETIEAGSVGEVVSFGSFGTFYRNGYNQPNRGNTSVVLRREDGTLFRASLEKCRMARDYATPESLRAKAVELSYNYHWPGASGARCAWLTHNFGAALVAAVTSRVRQASAAPILVSQPSAATRTTSTRSGC